MTKIQLEAIKAKIADILGDYMPKSDALERANNIAQIFVWGDEVNISSVSHFIMPNTVKLGISDISVREYVAAQICALKGNEV